MKSEAKVLKYVGTDHFELTLIQLDSGNYYIITTKNEIETTSEPIRDLSNAMFIFESKFMQLQGH